MACTAPTISHQPALAVEPTTGEVHLRHHISPSGVLPRQEGRQGQGRVIVLRQGRLFRSGPPALFCHDSPHRHRLHGGPRTVGDGAGGPPLSNRSSPGARHPGRPRDEAIRPHLGAAAESGRLPSFTLGSRGHGRVPGLALRNKKDSSMRVAINLVNGGEADACVSAGNTGALMAISRFVLKMMPGIDRPAICAAVPTLNGHTHMLDLGANVDCGPGTSAPVRHHGATLVSAMEHATAPRSASSISARKTSRATRSVKAAAELLRQSGLNFIGNVEGDGIYKGDADVVVCDGFVGNVALKASEGLAQMLASFLRQEFKRNWLTKIVALMAMPVLNAFQATGRSIAATTAPSCSGCADFRQEPRLRRLFSFGNAIARPTMPPRTACSNGSPVASPRTGQPFRLPSRRMSECIRA